MKSAHLSEKIRPIILGVGEKADYLLYASIVVYTMIFSYHTILEHRAFMTGLDLASYDRSLWMAIRYGELEGRFFVRPILLLPVLPVYALFPAPETLLVIQSLFIALGALPIYRLVSERFRGRPIGLVFAIAYLLYVPLHGVNCFDFHTESLIPSLFLLSFYLYTRGEWARSLIFAALSLSCSEFMPFVMFSFGVYIGVLTLLRATGTGRLRDKVRTAPFRFALVVMALSVIWFVSVSGGMGILGQRTGGPAGLWIFWGSTPVEVVVNALSNPVDAVMTLFSPEKADYLIHLLSPVLFLPLLSPLALLPALPWFIAALLSADPTVWSIEYQYSSFIVAPIFIASAYGFERLSMIKPGKPNVSVLRMLPALLIAVNLFLTLTLSPVGPLYSPERKPTVGFHEDMLMRTLELIPPEASVLAQENVYPHVCQRPDISFVCFERPSKTHPSIDAEYVIADVRSPHYSPMEDVVPLLLNASEYGLYGSADGVLLFKREHRGGPILYVPYVAVYDYRDLEVHSGSVVYDATSKSSRSLVHATRDAPNVVFWHGPYEFLPPGHFVATFRLRMAPAESGRLNGPDRVLTIDASTGAGRICLALRDVRYADFEEAGAWQNFTLPFMIDEPRMLELRGAQVSNATDIYLDYVEVRQMAPPAKAIRPPNSAYSLAFDGIDDFVEVPDSPSLRLTDELTLECWVELRTRPPTNSYLILGKPGRWWLEGYPGGVVCWVSVDRVRVRTDFVQIPLDAFVHIVATYRGGELRAYLNGRLISSKTGIGGRLDPSDGVDVRMGNEFPATEAFWGTFDGMIDEARVYDRALARAEILENRRGNVTTDGLVAWWGFDEGSGGVAGDSSPHHNDGTIHGPTWHRFPGPAEAYLEEARARSFQMRRSPLALCRSQRGGL